MYNKYFNRFVGELEIDYNNIIHSIECNNYYTCKLKIIEAFHNLSIIGKSKKVNVIVKCYNDTIEKKKAKYSGSDLKPDPNVDPIMDCIKYLDYLEIVIDPYDFSENIPNWIFNNDIGDQCVYRKISDFYNMEPKFKRGDIVKIDPYYPNMMEDNFFIVIDPPKSINECYYFLYWNKGYGLSGYYSLEDEYHYELLCNHVEYIHEDYITLYEGPIPEKVQNLLNKWEQCNWEYNPEVFE